MPPFKAVKKSNEMGVIMEKSALSKNNGRKTVIGIILFVIVFGGLLALASVFDLQVSDILADLEPGEYLTKNPFGILFESIGSWPVYLMLSIATAIIYANTRISENKWLKTLGAAVANIVSFIAMYVLVTDTIGYFERHFEIESFTETWFATVIFVLVALACSELICYAFTKRGKEELRALLKFAFVIIFCAALSNLVVNVVKDIMCRPRYRTMNYFGDFSQYHRWYQRAEFPEITEEMKIVFDSSSGKDGFRSFPSGHTCAAGTIYSILALPCLFKKYDSTKRRVLLYFIAILVTGVVAVSRIVCGAHFFSDVLIGGTLAYVSAILGIKIFIKKDFNKV